MKDLFSSLVMNIRHITSYSTALTSDISSTMNKYPDYFFTSFTIFGPPPPQETNKQKTLSYNIHLITNNIFGSKMQKLQNVVTINKEKVDIILFIIPLSFVFFVREQNRFDNFQVVSIVRHTLIAYCFSWLPRRNLYIKAIGKPSRKFKLFIFETSQIWPFKLLWLIMCQIWIILTIFSATLPEMEIQVSHSIYRHFRQLRYLKEPSS